MFGQYHNTFAGVRIIESAACVDIVGEDWSDVRSPARARRRQKLGHPQRVKPLYAPKKEAFSCDGGRTIIMHPEMARALREKMMMQMAADMEERMNVLTLNTIMGR